MVDAVTVVALALLVAGIVGTLVPLVPGGILSLGGIYLYWWHADYADPGLVALVVLTLLGLAALLAELLGTAVTTRYGGGSWETTAAALVVGIGLAFFTGPLGLLAGLFGTVFVLEYVDDPDVARSARIAAYATGGMLASAAVQVALTTAVFVGFVVAVFLF